MATTAHRLRRRPPTAAPARQLRAPQLKLTQIVEFQAHRRAVNTIAFREGGVGSEKIVATAGDDGYSDGTIREFLLDNGGELLSEYDGHKGLIHDLAYSPDGRFRASVGDDGQLLLLNHASGLLSSVVHESGQHGCTFSSDSRLLVTCGLSGAVRVRDLGSGKQRAVFRPTLLDLAWACALSPDGGAVGVTGAHGLATLYELDSGRERSLFADDLQSLYSCAFSPDGQLFMATGARGLIRLWSVTSGSEVVTLCCDGASECGAFSPDGSLIAAVDARGLHLWQRTTMRHLRTVDLPGLTSLAFSSDCQHIVAGGSDGCVHGWQITLR